MWLLLLMLLLAMLCLAYLLLQAVAVAQSFAHSTEDQCCRTGVPLHEYEDEEKTICEPMMPPSRSELEQLKKELRSSLSMASTSRSTLTSTSRGAQVEELLGRTDLLLLLLLQLLLLFLLLLLLLLLLLPKLVQPLLQGSSFQHRKRGSGKKQRELSHQLPIQDWGLPKQVQGPFCLEVPLGKVLRKPVGRHKHNPPMCLHRRSRRIAVALPIFRASMDMPAARPRPQRCPQTVPAEDRQDS
mmetsp:Transcript_32625/g.70008  ORF Transcript_32625/g.70008 Transcript_32625/m.70008 type:complete len:242 (-) Transcript_32625:356-1081(-)